MANLTSTAEFYSKNGYVSGINVLSGNGVTRLQKNFGELEKNTGKNIIYMVNVLLVVHLICNDIFFHKNTDSHMFI